MLLGDCMLLYDKNRIQIHGCKLLMHISDNEIIIQCINDRYIIRGQNLKISEYGQCQMFIVGVIDSIGVIHA